MKKKKQWEVTVLQATQKETHGVGWDLTDPCEDSSLDLDFFSFLGLLGPICETVQLSSLQFASWSDARKAPLLPARHNNSRRQQDE